MSNFQPLEVVGRGSWTQVGAHYTYFMWRFNPRGVHRGGGGGGQRGLTY